MRELAEKHELTETQGRCYHFADALLNSVFRVPEGDTPMDRFTPQEIVREIEGIEHAANKELEQRQS